MHNTVGQKPRSAFVVVLLLLSLFLAATLAYEAARSAKSQRATAEGVLRDYSAFAAEQYGDRVMRELEFYGFYPAFRMLRQMEVDVRDGPLPSPASLRKTADRALEQSLTLVRYLFRLDLETGTVTLGAGSNGLAPDWLRDTLTTHARRALDADWQSAGVLAWDHGDPRFFAYALRHADGLPVEAYGFEVNIKELEGFFQSALERGPVLPTTLIGNVAYDSVVAVRIATLEGKKLFRFPGDAEFGRTYDTPPAARYALNPRLAGLEVQVALRPWAADMLVIGGLPRSRLPLVLLLFVLTAGLIVAALLQLRREHDLAKARTDFVSNVSHELRTPLAQIRMFAETLLLGRVRSSAEKLRSLEIIDQEARRLTTLVENVLHFSRAERNRVRITPEPTDLAVLIAEVIESFQPLAATRHVVVQPQAHRIIADVDRGAVQQILVNLLDNAVKYGPEGQTVQVASELQNDHVRITVEDEGPGIPQRDRERIWQRFWRPERERDQAVAGTGIGLAVVRELAELHGGRSWVEPRAGRGSRFVVELPGARAAPTSQPTAWDEQTPAAAGTSSPTRP